MMATEIERREDVNPKEGVREYGDVEFADPTNKKYPIDSPGHLRTAWSYTNQYASQNCISASVPGR